MSDTPEILDAAYAAGARATQRYTETELRAHVAAGYVLDAAAPLICAHELRSVADDLEVFLRDGRPWVPCVRAR